jgi:hypothetical protein
MSTEITTQPRRAPLRSPARSPVRSPARAWIRLPSGRRLDLLAPTPFDWTDDDLAIGLARTFRWGGHSIWPDAPLSVAQHSLAVLERRRRSKPLSAAEQLRELLHDAEEGLINFDCISPLKPFLGAGFSALQSRLAAVVALRYRLPPWSPQDKRDHKQADIAAAAAEAVHIAGWTVAEVRETLGIKAKMADRDLLAGLYGEVPWQPWPPDRAASRFAAELARLQALRDDSPAQDRLTPP